MRALSLIRATQPRPWGRTHHTVIKLDYYVTNFPKQYIRRRYRRHQYGQVLLQRNISRGGSRGGARGPGPSLIFRPNWGPKGRKHVFGDRGPPYLRVWMTTPHPPAYLNVWIRQWYRWSYGSLVPKVIETGLGSLEHIYASFVTNWCKGDTNPMTNVTWSYKRG